MAKYNIDEIKKEAEITLATYRGRPGKAHAKNLSVLQMRVYITKVLFLCKEIEKLETKK